MKLLKKISARLEVFFNKPIVYVVATVVAFIMSVIYFIEGTYVFSILWIFLFVYDLYITVKHIKKHIKSNTFRFYITDLEDYKEIMKSLTIGKKTYFYLNKKQKRILRHLVCVIFYVWRGYQLRLFEAISVSIKAVNDKLRHKEFIEFIEKEVVRLRLEESKKR